MKEETLTRMGLARTMLHHAQLCLEHKMYRSAISRAYYACHHAARACLEQISMELTTTRSTHSACVRLFSLHFIEPRIFPVNMIKALIDLNDHREHADYELEFLNLKETAIAYLKNAIYFMEEVENRWQKLR